MGDHLEISGVVGIKKKKEKKVEPYMAAPCPIFCLCYLKHLRIRNEVFSLIQYLTGF